MHRNPDLPDHRPSLLMNSAIAGMEQPADTARAGSLAQYYRAWNLFA